MFRHKTCFSNGEMRECMDAWMHEWLNAGNRTCLPAGCAKV